MFAQLFVGLMIPLYWLAELCWYEQSWWRMWSANIAFLIITVFVHLFLHRGKL